MKFLKFILAIIFPILIILLLLNNCKGCNREEDEIGKIDKPTPRPPRPPQPEPRPNPDSVLARLIDNMVLIDVEGLQLNLGATPGQESSLADETVHTVMLSSYKIARYEVTQEEWEAVMGSNPSHFKGAKRPVENVSWDDCQQFIRKLNEMTGKEFRLPTEAEWEVAAGGGNNMHDYKYAGSNNIDEVAWFDYNSKRVTHSVKQKKANELGLYDMSGNVWEWCQDWFGGYGSGKETNPTGPSGGSYRVLRGGSCYYDAQRCRVACRDCIAPDNRNPNFGFRLALVQQ